jgi:RimJ/RimL family protein N-acetyltransferase
MPWQRHTERLILRRWTDSDREPFAALNADEEVRRYFVGVLTREESDASIDRFEAGFDSRGYGLWAVERRDTGEFIGFTGLNPMPEGIPGQGGVEIGWRLARDHWGHGFATEAALESLRFAFDELGLGQVNSITAVGNTRSRSVMERIGMSQQGFFEHPAVPVGTPLREHVRYVIGSLP